MAENILENFKKALSYLKFCCKQLRKSPFIYFIIFLLSYFLFPISNLSNKKYFLAEVIKNSSLKAYSIILCILILFSLVHFTYLLYLYNRHDKVKFRTFIISNKRKCLVGFIFTFIVLTAFYLIYRIFNYSNYLFANLWLYIIISNAFLYITYFIIGVGLFVIFDFSCIKASYINLSIRKILARVWKMLMLIMTIDIFLSPLMFALENQLISPNPFSNVTGISSWIYFILECLIDTFVVMLIYNYLEVRIHNNSLEIVHGRAFKRILLTGLLLIYLFVWFTCGIIFQTVAKQSNGKDFIFQEDLQLSLQAKALKEVTGIKADDYTVCELLKGNELNKEVISFKKVNGMTKFTSDSSNNLKNINLNSNFDYSEPEGTLCVNTIGKLWAEFYSSNFYRNGISKYKFEVGDSIEVPKDLGFKDEKLYPVTIFLYKTSAKNMNFDFREPNMISLLSNNDELSKYKLVSKYTILIENSSFVSSLKNALQNQETSRNPRIANLVNVLQHSVVFIDYDYQRVCDMFNMVETQGVRFPLLDFLYYSAVTITTTGYGDILPNSTLIRTLVMFEAFFGVGIPGLFISLLFFKVDHKEKKNMV